MPWHVRDAADTSHYTLRGLFSVKYYYQKTSDNEKVEIEKELPGFNQPVVILTANAITGMKEKYLQEGFEDYLAKPIEKDELIRVCNMVFNKYKSSEPNPPEEVEELEIIGEDEPSNKEQYLRENNVDIDKALELLSDMNMYDMTISDFLSEVEEKWNNIITYKNNSDMENYAIEVHSLKSDAKYLGFTSLADISYQHELHSKENDIAFVEENFQKLECEYQKVLSIAKEYNKM